jgi:hypothetical protein
VAEAHDELAARAGVDADIAKVDAIELAAADTTKPGAEAGYSSQPTQNPVVAAGVRGLRRARQEDPRGTTPWRTRPWHRSEQSLQSGSQTVADEILDRTLTDPRLNQPEIGSAREAVASPDAGRRRRARASRIGHQPVTIATSDPRRRRPD